MITENILPNEYLVRLENFGHSVAGPSYLFRPTHVDQIVELFHQAKRLGFTIGLRGSGLSYGDAAMNNGQVVLDFQRMNRILEWDPATGIIKVEPGVTIERLWRYTLEDGWLSPVNPGTMFPTIGGCLGANVHGKNNWVAGTIGEHVLEFTALLPSGREVTCSPTRNKELFYSMIGGMGLLGVFTSITYQMKKVHSGDFAVYAWAEPNIRRILEATDEEKENDYIVGWVDCTARGRRLGRGQMHLANYLKPGEEAHLPQSLSVKRQDLSPNLFGIVPRSIIPLFMRLGLNNLGAWAGNWGKYLASRTLSHKKHYRQSFVAFNFLLDYVPGWEYAYGRGGLIQYQSFMPKHSAGEIYEEMLRITHRHRLPSYLGVVKRHRPDDFLLSHSLDGFSLAMDFRITDRNRKRMRTLTRELNRLVLDGGGRFYFAKDITLTPDVTRAFLGDPTIEKLKGLKEEHDPDGILQTDLYRRCFGG